MLDPTDLPAPRALPKHDGLPDPLERFDGGRVESAREWKEERRPELLALFEHYMYGHVPEAVPIEIETEELGRIEGGDLRETVVTLPTGFSVRFLHVHPDEPGAVVVGLNRRGNHTVVEDERVTVTPGAEAFGAAFDGSGDLPAPRGARADAWCVDHLLDAGYGLLTACCADVDPDRDEFDDGVHVELGSPGPTGTGWGTTAAWAWGLSRGLDYLETDPRATGSAAFGFSRLGKAALFAGARDERFDALLPHQSGTGGLTLSRENDQETVGRITRAHPHWFADLFAAFAGREERLPFDQHCLVALAAPRPILDTQGMRDPWINAPRSLDALVAATPVYELLGEEGEVDRRFAEEGAADAGVVCQYRRETDHEMSLGYWEVTTEFLDAHL